MLKRDANNRNSNIEWLRIIAILLITFNHIYNKGVDKAVILEESESVNAVISVFFLMGGKFGCNLFLIISSWFIADKGVDWRAALKIWIQTVFYTIMLDIVSVVIFHAELTLKDILAIFSPLTFGTYWYSTAYVIMLLLGPIVRKLFNKCGKYKTVILICGGLLLSIVPTMTLEGTVFRSNKYVSLIFKVLTYAPIWFLYVYLLIGQMKGNTNTRNNPNKSLLISIVLYIGMFIVTMVLFRGVGSGKIPGAWQFAAWRQMNSPICFLSAYYLFTAARDAKKKSNNWVNRITGYVYGIYLFQCHKTFQGFLWTKILVFEKFFHLSISAFVLYSIFGVCVIIILGFLCDSIYKQVYKTLQKTIPILQ